MYYNHNLEFMLNSFIIKDFNYYPILMIAFDLISFIIIKYYYLIIRKFINLNFFYFKEFNCFQINCCLI